MTPAERIEELEAEVAYLKSELGLSVDATKVVAIKNRLRITQQQAQILAILHACYPRVLSRYQIWDAIDHPIDGSDAYAANSINVRISGIRKLLGGDVITVSRRLGLGLTANGHRVVSDCVDAAFRSAVQNGYQAVEVTC